MVPDAQAPLPEPDEEEIEPPDGWRPRPNRLMIGLALIVLALVWLILNGRLAATQGTGAGAHVVHGPVLTRVESIGSVRARPELAPAATGRGPTVVEISFHNAGTVTRLITPQAVRLVVRGRSVPPDRGGHDALGRIMLQPGRYVTGALRFDAAPAPGAVLVFRPFWAHGHSLRWLLWR